MEGQQIHTGGSIKGECNNLSSIMYTPNNEHGSLTESLESHRRYHLIYYNIYRELYAKSCVWIIDIILESRRNYLLI